MSDYTVMAGGILLQGILDIGQGQQAIETVIDGMSDLFRRLRQSPRVLSFLRRFYIQVGATPENLVHWSMINLDYEFNPPRTDRIINPLRIIKDRVGDCNEINYMIGIVLAVNGWTVEHVTADGLDVDLIDEHYWIRFQSAAGWVNVDITLWAMRRQNPYEIDWQNWLNVNYWNFESGRRIA